MHIPIMYPIGIHALVHNIQNIVQKQVFKFYAQSLKLK